MHVACICHLQGERHCCWRDCPRPGSSWKLIEVTMQPVLWACQCQNFADSGVSLWLPLTLQPCQVPWTLLCVREIFHLPRWASQVSPPLPSLASSGAGARDADRLKDRSFPTVPQGKLKKEKWKLFLDPLAWRDSQLNTSWLLGSDAYW